MYIDMLNVKTRKLLLVAVTICLTAFFTKNAVAVDTVATNQYDIMFEWEYQDIPELQGFKLYIDKVLLYTVTDKAARSVTVKQVPLNPITCFTMTAYGDAPEEESRHSVEYCVKRPLPAPIMIRPKYYRYYLDSGPVVFQIVK